MSTDLSMSLSALRFALKQLQREGLVTVTADERATTFTIPTVIAAMANLPGAAPALTASPGEILQAQAQHIATTLGTDSAAILGSIKMFLDLQELRGKKWQSDKELVHHFCNWWLQLDQDKVKKHAKRQQQQEQRQDEVEYQEQRAREREAAEIAKTWSWIEDAQRRAAAGDKKAAELLAHPYYAQFMKEHPKTTTEQ